MLWSCSGPMVIVYTAGCLSLKGVWLEDMTRPHWAFTVALGPCRWPGWGGRVSECWVMQSSARTQWTSLRRSWWAGRLFIPLMDVSRDFVSDDLCCLRDLSSQIRSWSLFYSYIHHFSHLQKSFATSPEAQVSKLICYHSEKKLVSSLSTSEIYLL